MVSKDKPGESVQYIRGKLIFFGQIPSSKEKDREQYLVYSIFIILQGTLCCNGTLNITMHFTLLKLA